MEELWSIIPEFPDYAVSNLGKIRNIYSNREYTTTINNWGHVKISFGPERITRSVAVLVAEAFVEPPDELSTSIIHLDGNFENVRFDNLAWRPMSFSWYYTRQFKKQQPLHYKNIPVLNLDLYVEYECVIKAGTTEGVLFDDIWDSTWRGRRPYPFHYKYQIVHRL